jgi:hypothetical protein
LFPEKRNIFAPDHSQEFAMRARQANQVIVSAKSELEYLLGYVDPPHISPCRHDLVYMMAACALRVVPRPAAPLGPTGIFMGSLHHELRFSDFHHS